MQLFKTKNKGPGQKRGRWRLMAEGGGMGSQIHHEGDTYLNLSISNTNTVYQLRVSPQRVQALQVECEEFLKELRGRGWDL